MKQFLKYTSILIIGLLISMVLLDMAYTRIYNTGTYRNKVMWIRDMQPDTLDYALFGSSRTKYTVNPTRN